MSNNFKEKNINFPNYWYWNGFKICWSVTGEDNEIPIIFLHGFGASRKHWRKNLEYFAKKNYAAYSLDLIGFGDSDQPGICLLYTSPSPRDRTRSRMPSSA